jgi:V/A-type H+-transporting ATPase subunit A
MMVVGEEGTSTDDYVVYQKSELIDFVYLQQNSFDEVDCFCSEERQNHVFELLRGIANTTMKFKNKEEARRYFASLRQKFLDCNFAKWESDEYKKNEAELLAMVEEVRDV